MERIEYFLHVNTLLILTARSRANQVKQDYKTLLRARAANAGSRQSSGNTGGITQKTKSKKI